MKKILLLTAICAAAFVGCTDDENQSQQTEINFSPLSFKNTRSIIDGNIYGTSAGDFGIYAYYLGTGSWKVNGASAQKYIDNAVVSYDGTDNIWKSTPKAYWPLNGSLTFFAYSPLSAGGTYSVAGSVGTFEIKDYVAESDEDLLYSRPEDASDVLKGDEKNNTYNSGSAQSTKKGVSIKFRHALTQILVKAKIKEAYVNTTFTITKLELKNLKNKATFTLATTWDGSTSTYEANWTEPTDNAPTLQIPGVSDVSLNSSNYVNVGTGVLVMPQTLSSASSGAQELAITYEMTYNGVESSTTKSVKLNNGTLTALQKNQKLTLVIDISADEIMYAPRVENWDESNSPTYTY